ncbi:MAG: hypothetical protein KGL13_08735 [Gammaproteobacteria bacterium]|nr:hypothetical protein [Gammaproteobacteria bacterium]MDE2346541.1 hypothetical protein [Gammaproteobacteria bacterium]
MVSLNASQRRYLRSILDSVGTHLAQITQIASLEEAGETNSRGFSRSDVECLTAFSRELRTRMDRLIAEFRLDHDKADRLPSKRWNVVTRLEFMSVELAELSRKKLSGFGPLDDAAFRSIMHRLNELQVLIDRQKQMLDPG